MKPLTIDRAKKLARALSGRDSTYLKSHGCVRVRVDEEAGRIVFEHVEYVKNHILGGYDFGEVLSSHSLALNVTSEERAVAHYDGFCTNHGFGVRVGSFVYIPSGSATSGWRRVTVTKVTGRRVHYRGRYGHGGSFESVCQKGEVRCPGKMVAEYRRGPFGLGESKFAQPGY